MESNKKSSKTKSEENVDDKTVTEVRKVGPMFEEETRLISNVVVITIIIPVKFGEIIKIMT